MIFESFPKLYLNFFQLNQGRFQRRGIRCPPSLTESSRKLGQILTSLFFKSCSGPFFWYIKHDDVFIISPTFCLPKAKIMEIITRMHDYVRRKSKKHIMERRVYGGPRSSDYFHDFGLWKVKSRTYCQDIIMFYIPKERPHLVLQLSLNKLVKIWSKYSSFGSKASNIN